MSFRFLCCRKVHPARARGLKVGSSLIVRTHDLVVHIGVKRGESFPGKRGCGQIACSTPDRAGQVLVTQKVKNTLDETVNICGYEGVLTVFAGKALEGKRSTDNRLRHCPRFQDFRTHARSLEYRSHDH